MKKIRLEILLWVQNPKAKCQNIMVVVCLLLSESVLLLLAPHVHHLPIFVHLHGVVHQPIHVDELDALLLGVKQHWRNDRQLSHLLLCVLTHTESNILE